ncbi:MAG: hypothetical protein IJS94_07375 [Clostridia bacterium]|nr:hypothetical protein [Clostridia bacterium]
MKKDKTDTEEKENIEKTEAEENQEDKKFFSDKKTVVRFILFIIAFVTAVAFITYGVSHIGHKEEGVYEITCDKDDEVPHYYSGITFMYNFTGSSSEINSMMKFIKGEYAEKLKMNYKLLDPVNTYEGLVNIAYINQNPGIRITVGDELFEVLSDAYEKTCEKNGYDMFSGLSARLRDQTVYSADAAEHDYYLDESLRDVMSKIKEISSKENSVIFELDSESHTVLFDLSDEYKAFLKEYEPDGAVLDLDLLHDAYMLKYVVRALEKDGYTDGYITTADGLSILLSGMSEVELCLYSVKDSSEETVISATVSGKGGVSASSFRAFALTDNELGFYTYKKDGKILYRNKYISDFEKELSVLSCVSVSSEFNAVEAVYSNITLFISDDAAAASSAAGKTDCSSVMYELNENDKTVYVKTGDGVKINTAKGYSFEIID